MTSTIGKQRALRTPILDLVGCKEPLSVRTFNKLKSKGIETVRDLVQYSYEELSEINQLGQRGMCEIETLLTNMNLKLKNTKKMKVELIKEERFNESPYYIIRVDDKFVTGSPEQEKAEKLYNDLISNPDALKTKIEILKSQEIDVPLAD